jgi:hypothetical protein
MASKRQYVHETDVEEDDHNRTGVTAKKKKWLTKFKWCYSSEFQCLTKSTKGPHFAHCKICISDFSISHGGRDDCKLFHNFINVP